MIVLWALESAGKDWVKSKLPFFLLSIYHDSEDILDPPGCITGVYFASELINVF